MSFGPTYLRHFEGRWAGKPFELFDFQINDIFYPLFGWKNTDGFRRFRIAYIELPKKNGKSAIAGYIGCYMLVGDGEAGAEVYSTGVDGDSASIVHDVAIKMVDRSPALSSILKINRTTKNIAYPGTQSFYRALSGQPAEGIKAHCLLMDEVHAWKGRAGAQQWEALQGAGAMRDQPLVAMITTGGDDESYVCLEQQTYAKSVALDEIHDVTTFSYIAAADPADDWTDPAIWRKANPALGLILKEEDIATQCLQAKNNPSAEATFKRRRLNIWSSSSNPWIAVEEWDACGDASLRPEDFHGCECWGALDLSKSRDMSAFDLIFKDTDDSYVCFEWAWLPEDVIKSTSSPALYSAWHREGRIFQCEGPVIEYADIESFIVGNLAKNFLIKEIAFDPMYALPSMQRINAATGIPHVEFRQTIMNFADPVKEMERLIFGRKIRHAKNPVTRWCFKNVEMYHDLQGNKRPIKADKKTGSKKIDPIVAKFMSLARAKLAPVSNYFPVEAI